MSDDILKTPFEVEPRETWEQRTAREAAELEVSRELRAARLAEHRAYLEARERADLKKRSREFEIKAERGKKP